MNGVSRLESQRAIGGAHPAVLAYCKKLEIVDKNVSVAMKALNRQIQQFIADMRRAPSYP